MQAMSRPVPAATRALRVLRYLASQPDPVPLERIIRAVGMPRSSAYHLLGAMIDEGFVTHIEDDHRYALGVTAFEVGSGYSRQAPLQRIARRPIAELVDAVGESGHFAVLHGRRTWSPTSGSGCRPSSLPRGVRSWRLCRRRRSGRCSPTGPRS
jgi:DNA-binding IclR family transcriptional regulator